MFDLFSIKDDIKIKNINYRDIILKSDDAELLKKLIAENEPMYPSIDNWYRQKVIPGLKSLERSAFIGYFNNKPMITAITKKGKNSKFCHLRIGKDFQNIKLGDLFFCIMAFEVRNWAKEIHFTLPESLWYEKKEFFKSFGFNHVIF